MRYGIKKVYIYVESYTRTLEWVSHKEKNVSNLRQI